MDQKRRGVRLRFLLPLVAAVFIALPPVLGLRMQQADVIMILVAAGILTIIPLPGLLPRQR